MLFWFYNSLICQITLTSLCQPLPSSSYACPHSHKHRSSYSSSSLVLTPYLSSRLTTLHLWPVSFSSPSLFSGNPGWPVRVWAGGAAGTGPGQGKHQQRDGGSVPGTSGGGHIRAAKRLPVRHYWHQWVGPIHIKEDEWASSLNLPESAEVQLNPSV